MVMIILVRLGPEFRSTVPEISGKENGVKGDRLLGEEKGGESYFAALGEGVRDMEGAISCF